jgi:uncharacterized protein (TIGR00369 family)
MWTGPAFVEWMKNSGEQMYVRQPLSRGLSERCEELDHATGHARVSFELGTDHLNFTGRVHGGIAALLLDEAIGMASLAHAGHRFKGTVEAKVSYYRSLRPGTVVAEARVLHAATTIMFVEATLSDHEGQVAAKSTSTIALAPATT